MSLFSGPRGGYLRFEGGRLLLDTAFCGRALAEVLVDGRPAGPWEPAADGRWESDCGELRLSAAAEEGGWRLALRNAGSAPLRLGSATFARWKPESFRPGLDAGLHRELVHGGSYRDTGCGVKCVGERTALLPNSQPSSLFALYGRETGAALLLGVVPPLGAELCTVRTLHAEPHMEGAFGFEVLMDLQCTLEPGTGISVSTLAVLEGPDPLALLSAYGDLWSRCRDGRAIRPRTVGWNSWDAYSGAVTRAHMDANIAAAERLFPGAVRTFVIDEGWEQQWGGWVPNSKLGDLREFCRSVRERGATPGIWTAPLLVNAYHPLFLDRPDWFARGDDGQIRIDSYAYGPMAYLDPTREDVLEHLRELFTRLRSWGFGYFKVDFTQCVLLASGFSDGRVGRGDLLRRAFRAVRQAVGEEAALVSCGAPFESVAGIADAARISGDIHVYWTHVMRNAAAFSVRWWMQGRLWNNDPDFLVVRGPDTARPPFGKHVPVRPADPASMWMAGRVFDENEARAYALLVHLAGGETVLSDGLDLLNGTGRDIVSRAMGARGKPGVPEDLFHTEQVLPRIWISRGSDDAVVGLFNWLDVPARVDFRPEDHGLDGVAMDFWTGKRVPALPARQPRRSALALVYGKGIGG